MLLDCGKGCVYSVIVSFGVISLLFPFFIVKGLFGAHATWPQRPIYALGAAFSYNRNLCQAENFTSKINKFQKLFNKWSQRDLLLYGRILIAKILGLSILIYSSSCVQTPAQVPDIVNKLGVNFMWNCKKPKIKRDTLIGPKDKGGLELPNYEIIHYQIRAIAGFHTLGAWVQVRVLWD